MTVVHYLHALLLSAWVDDDEGQTMAEYGLILAGIAIVVMVAVWALGGQLFATFEAITAELGGGGGTV